MHGSVGGQQALVLKDDGCNTNAMSRSYSNKNRHLLKTKKAEFVILHSNNDTTEEANEIMKNADIQIGPIATDQIGLYQIVDTM